MCVCPLGTKFKENKEVNDAIAVSLFFISTWVALFQPCWLYFGFSLQLNSQFLATKMT